ncbi:hypothetical protein D3C86_1642270 [compost metagenome]
MGGGQQQEVVTFEQLVQGPIPVATVDRSLIDIRCRQAQPAFDFPLRFGFELLAFLWVGVQRTEAALHQPVAMGQPGLPQALHGEIRLTRFDLATQCREVLQRRFAQAHHTGVHGQITVVVPQPSHADLAEILHQ